MSTWTDGAMLFSLPQRSAYIELTAIPAPQPSVIACDTKTTRVVEVNGKRYRAHVTYDDGVEVLTWGARDEIKDGEK